MATVDDVAAAIVERLGPIDTFKLQKLVYYCQAWHLVWEEQPLFGARIEAWANGPVVRELYDQHRGRYRVDSWPSGDPFELSDAERESIDVVVEFYGKKPGYWLAELTHRETPWREAREESGLGPGERGTVEITLAAMDEYYGSLVGTD